MRFLGLGIGHQGHVAASNPNFNVDAMDVDVTETRSNDMTDGRGNDSDEGEETDDDSEGDDEGDDSEGDDEGDEDDTGFDDL